MPIYSHNQVQAALTLAIVTHTPGANKEYRQQLAAHYFSLFRLGSMKRANKLYNMTMDAVSEVVKMQNEYNHTFIDSQISRSVIYATSTEKSTANSDINERANVKQDSFTVRCQYNLSSTDTIQYTTRKHEKCSQD